MCGSGVTGPPISGDHCAALAPLRDNVSAVVTPPRPAPAPAPAGTPRQWGAGCDHGATETDAALALATIQSNEHWTPMALDYWTSIDNQRYSRIVT